MGFAKTVFKQKSKENKSLLRSNIRRNNVNRFCVTAFLPMMMNILCCQLINRLEGIKSVVTSYQVLEQSFLSNAFHLYLEVETRKFSNKFFDNVSSFVS